MRAVRPDLHRGFNPWDRITELATVRALLEESGVLASEIVAEPGERRPRRGGRLSWARVIAEHSSRCTPTIGERVRIANFSYVRVSGIRSVEANVVYALATKP